jgi:hypothetical protein
VVETVIGSVAAVGLTGMGGTGGLAEAVAVSSKEVGMMPDFDLLLGLGSTVIPSGSDRLGKKLGADRG